MVQFLQPSGERTVSTVKQTDHYQALGISPTASPREVKESYLGWIRYFDHPEERPKPVPLQGSLTEQIEQVQRAYDLLADENLRAQYNTQLNVVPGAPEPESAPAARPSPRAYGDVEVMIAKRKQARCYLEFFGLKEKPFELTPDPNYFYLSSRHKEVLAQLILALQENRGIVKIVGEVGTGKTTLCHNFLKELNSGIDFAYLFHPCSGVVELMQSINAEFGLPSQNRNKNELLHHLRQFLIKKKNEGRGVALVVDEAQDLAPEMLEELRILSNLETETDKLLQIVLIGQPELNKTLGRAPMRQLLQRISAQWELFPMNVEETHGYIQHRLNVAGGKGKVAFSRSAADAVFRAAGGIPRLVNRLADQALAEAHQQGVKKIDHHIIRDAEKEQENLQPHPLNRGGLWKLMGGLVVIGGLAMIMIYFMTQFSWPDPVAQGNTLAQMIEQTPMDLSQPGRLVVQPAPKTRTLASVGNPAEQSAMGQGATGAESLSHGSEPAVSLSTEEELVNTLATLTAGESKIEAARWVLNRWGAVRKETVTLNPRAREILKTDYGLSVYESNGNLNRLTTLNYPALVELALPDGGVRYLALMGLEGDVGVFQSNETLEIPLTLFDALWTHKAWVLWNNFEGLPGDMQTGYQGKYAEWLQIQLNRLGYYNGPPAPQYGRRTADAVAKFQRYYNLKDHGRLDTETKLILYNRLPAYHAPRLTGG